MLWGKAILNAELCNYSPMVETYNFTCLLVCISSGKVDSFFAICTMPDAPGHHIGPVEPGSGHQMLNYGDIPG